MDHISANLVFGRRKKKYLGVQKGPGGGGQEAYMKNQKKRGDLFFFFFWRLKICGGRKKISRGHQMVTLSHCGQLGDFICKMVLKSTNSFVGRYGCI